MEALITHISIIEGDDITVIAYRGRSGIRTPGAFIVYINSHQHHFLVDFLIRTAALAPTAVIVIFFILVSSFFAFKKLKSDTELITNWKYVGIGAPSTQEIMLMNTTKQIIATKVAIFYHTFI